MRPHLLSLHLVRALKDRLWIRRTATSFLELYSFPVENLGCTSRGSALHSRERNSCEMVKDKFELEEDEDLCVCCLDGTVYEDNEILLCDKCDVPVHQSCYGIKTVPDEDW